MAQVLEKKGGPYSKNEKIKRQNEVFRLHFELGYSAVKISEMMKVNRNTINSDIHYWYGILSKEWSSYDIDAWYMKQIHRLESQRTRLFKELEKTTETTVRLSIEKMILDIDIKMTNFVSKSVFNQKTMKEQSVSWVNKWAKDMKIDFRLVDEDAVLYASEKTKKKIQKLLEEDKIEKRGKI